MCGRLVPGAVFVAVDEPTIARRSATLQTASGKKNGEAGSVTGPALNASRCWEPSFG
jgi:hypothetical protein